jgi:hypothetical protein
MSARCEYQAALGGFVLSVVTEIGAFVFIALVRAPVAGENDIPLRQYQTANHEF